MNRRTVFEDAGTWALNVVSSVVIIMVNKVLMGSSGYAYNFAVTLSGLHFLASSAAVHLMSIFGYVEKDKTEVPLEELALLVTAHALCVLLLNLSLMINTVGLYQMAKLLVIPLVCLLEYLWFSRSFPPPVLCSVVTVVAGVGAVTVTDLTLQRLGLCVALLSVLATGIMQTTCSSIQKKHGITSAALLLKAGLPMAVILLMMGPIMDKLFTDDWVFSYQYTLPSTMLILFSCAVAVSVNLSSFLCLGRFSVVSYQVMGHTKTFLVLVGGVVYFHEALSVTQLLGMTVAVAGMVSYGVLVSKSKQKILTKMDKDMEAGDTYQNPETISSETKLS
ncbi:hypothetical protein BSKO_09195 [Bryopsis sp. KO-2023]|nr:hypothetical protein BSKO_09195 [Bryopsis sp. KO-2023]